MPERKMPRLYWPSTPGPASSPGLGNQGQAVLGVATASPPAPRPHLLPKKHYPSLPWPICPAFCPLTSATSAGAQTMRAAGARRGGGTELTRNPTRPHLLNLAGLRHSPPATPGWRFRREVEMGAGGSQPPASLRLRGGAGNVLPRPSADARAPGPPSRPSRQGRGSAVARAGAEAAAPSPAPRPPAPHGALARPGARPAASQRGRGRSRGRGPAPGPALLTRGAAVRTHLRPRPLPGHPQRRRGRSPLGQRGGRGRRARAAAASAARPGSGKAPARLRAPGQPSAPGAGPEPAVPACPLALRRPPPRAAPRRPAAARSLRPLRGSGPLLQEAAQALPTGGGAARNPPRRRALRAAPPGERKPGARAGGGGGA